MDAGASSNNANNNSGSGGYSYRYQPEIEAMMFTFGEIRHALPETTQLVESLVREQLLQVLVQAAAVARRRASRHLTHEDIIFLIRRDRIKVARLTAYLSWRKVRKIANRTGSAAAAAAASSSSSGGATSGGSGVGGSGVDLVDEEQLLEDGEEGVERSKVKKVKIKFPWNLLDQFEDFGGADNDSDSEDTDEEEREFFRESRQRLKAADAITRDMTHEEYMDYAECRQASFTYKRPTRFRDWLQIEQYTGMRPSNDLLDIIGFLAFELVRNITEISLTVKRDMELQRNLEAATDASQPLADAETLLDAARQRAQAKWKPYSLFDCPGERKPIEPVHIHEAFRRMQRSGGFP